MGVDGGEARAGGLRESIPKFANLGALEFGTGVGPPAFDVGFDVAGPPHGSDGADDLGDLGDLDDLPAPPPAFETAAPPPASGPTLSSRVGALAESLETESRYADAALLYEVQAALAALGR